MLRYLDGDEDAPNQPFKGWNCSTILGTLLQFQVLVQDSVKSSELFSVLDAGDNRCELEKLDEKAGDSVPDHSFDTMRFPKKA